MIISGQNSFLHDALQDNSCNFSSEEAFNCVVSTLREGKAAIFPTDTVYGLGVSLHHAVSPAELFALKQRPANKPVALLVSGVDDLVRYGKDVPEKALQLAKAYWPGALTLVVNASDAVPRAFCSEAHTIGLRMPDNQTALALLRELGGALATTSANVSGEPAVESVHQLSTQLKDKVPIVADDASRSGVASTVIDCTKGTCVVLRQGDINITMQQKMIDGVAAQAPKMA